MNKDTSPVEPRRRLHTNPVLFEGKYAEGESLVKANSSSPILKLIATATDYRHSICSGLAVTTFKVNGPAERGRPGSSVSSD